MNDDEDSVVQRAAQSLQQTRGVREERTFFGVYPMLYSFFGADGLLHRVSMRRQVDACVAAGAHGIGILGIVGEMNKLEAMERRQILEWVAEDLAGRRPLAVTVSEPSIRGQVEFVRAAEAARADWVILQPPRIKNLPEMEYVRFFGSVADQASVPVAVQNNSVNMDIWISNAALNALRRNHPNVVIVKQEGPASMVHRMIEETGRAFDVFAGLNGREVISSLRAGAVGVIPAPESVDVQVKIFDLLNSGRTEDIDKAERLYAEFLPLLLYMNESPPHMHCYGKRFMARRLGLGDVHDRCPAISPTAFGLSVTQSLTRSLLPFQ
jgi:4-hydroxy-tetrahydrodipicolinate synthase